MRRRRKSTLTREGRLQLEKHCHDVFLLILKGLVAMETGSSILPEDTKRLPAMLFEYFRIKGMLAEE